MLRGEDARGPNVETWVAQLFGDLDDKVDDDGDHLAERLATLGAAMGRHGLQPVEIQLVAAKLATRLTKVLGKRREQVASMLANELLDAAKDHRPVDGDADSEAGDLIDELNNRFALVVIGGSTRVVEPDAFNPDLGQRYARLIRVGDFHTMLANRWVPRPGQQPTTAAACWLGHARRRQSWTA